MSGPALFEHMHKINVFTIFALQSARFSYLLRNTEKSVLINKTHHNYVNTIIFQLQCVKCNHNCHLLLGGCVSAQ